MDDSIANDPVVQDIYKKLEREKNIAIVARNVRQGTTNPLLQERCDSNIREAQKNIDYLTQTLQQLKLRKRFSALGSSNTLLPDSSGDQQDKESEKRK